eukprot:TRINITY_DN6166_c0_g1_i1.p3 TRINITY_DN6166_c0_g1~~TRINITY_DN6166_c0_g1_i1.p3  ORF type:complete len:108 (+),score=7.54 TRINITY_DN6166_c0_g1_i1:234-557(+)
MSLGGICCLQHFQCEVVSQCKLHAANSKVFEHDDGRALMTHLAGLDLPHCNLRPAQQNCANLKHEIGIAKQRLDQGSIAPSCSLLNQLALPVQQPTGTPVSSKSSYL